MYPSQNELSPIEQEWELTHYELERKLEVKGEESRDSGGF
jgi:hypothetical protein